MSLSSDGYRYTDPEDGYHAWTYKHWLLATGHLLPIKEKFLTIWGIDANQLCQTRHQMMMMIPPARPSLSSGMMSPGGVKTFGRWTPRMPIRH
jgi:hypothetical protein